MEKRKRLALITKIIRENSLPDQDSLKTLLEENGVKISQSSLSRDIKELGVQRVRKTNGTFSYLLPEENPIPTSIDHFQKRFLASVISIQRSNFIVLLKTPPGEAQIVGRLLDQASFHGLLGTVAGDDTVICITSNNQSAKSLEQNFNELIE
jgi:transcriptional regulator of arginine metabolism